MKMSKIEHFDKSTIVSDFLIFLTFNNLAILSHTSERCRDVHLNFIIIIIIKKSYRLIFEADL